MPLITFKGKTIIQSHHLTVPYRTLVPDAAASLTERPTLDDNLIVHGDNLHALKALLPSFGGKVKCIYIDPPYNTGNEGWVYNDNVNNSMHQDWLSKVVARDDLTRHDKWLCMMYPRLRLLHELLRQDGAIFISIDDNEVHRLRALMDEIFGEENFVATVIWQKNYAPKSSAEFFSEDHDYILVYAKARLAFDLNLLPRTEQQDAVYKNPDNDPRGLWRPNNLAARNFYSKGTYPITCPGGRFIAGPPKGSYWRVSEKKLWDLHSEGRIWWGEDGNNIPAPKIYLSEVKQGRVSQTLWFYKDVGHTQEAKREILAILDFDDSEDVFITPKPTRLIKRILQIATDIDSSDIVLDSFAGTGTTGHAVLAMNAEDGGNRRFILIEQEAYADTLTAERIRRVIKGVPKAKDEALAAGYDGAFSYFHLGDALDEERLLAGNRLPSYMELARYAFFTATGEQLDETQVDERRYYLGESKRYEVYMLYAPDRDFLLKTPLNLSWAQSLSTPGEKTRLVIASHKYLDDHKLRELKMEYAQLPFAIYRFQV